ncbi:MAG: NFACT family protein [Candidatus Eiseniibacteriota bacterium]|nr:MAG: NFACT family protein [Candidatus Eisenbacteria bacterium]
MENLTLGKLIEEIRPEVVGRRVSRVTGSPPLSFHLELAGPSRNDPLALTFSLDPRFPSLLKLDTGSQGVSTDSLEIRYEGTSYLLREVPADVLPEGFVRTMSKLLGGTLLAGIEQFDRDRVVKASFARRGEEVHAVLWAELFGRRPSAVLVASPADSMLACSREGVSSAAGSLLRPGERYVPPSDAGRTDVESLSSGDVAALIRMPGEEPLSTRLSRRIKGLSPQAAAAIVEELGPATSPDPETLLAGLKDRLLGGGRRFRTAVRTSAHAQTGGPSAEHAPTRPAQPEGSGVASFDAVLLPLGAGSSYKKEGFSSKEFSTASDAVRFVYFRLCLWYRTSSASRIRRYASSVLKRLEKLRAALLDDMVSAQNAGDFRRTGELILANLRAVEKGSATLEVSDLHSDGKTQITVKLDPSLSPQRNAERYFKRARKAERALERVRKRLAAVEQAAESAEEFARAIEEETSLSEAARLTRELNLLLGRLRARKTLDMPPLVPVPALQAETEKGTSPRRRTAAFQVGIRQKPSPPGRRERRPVRRPTRGRRPGKGTPLMGRDGETTFSPRVFETSDGFTVLVGKNNSENDYITHRLAKPDDLWFHASGMPGSHVVLRAKGKSAPSRTAIREAASLAAYFSKGRTSSAVPVIYTRRKYVRKPKGARPGTATYTREEFIMARPTKPGSSPTRPVS